MITTLKKCRSLKVRAIIFDWAGTTVDYGCFAPTGVFREVFLQKGIDISEKEARTPMGMYKRDHIKTITQFPRIMEEWRKKYGRDCSESDIEDMFQNFIPLQISVIDKHSKIVPELPDALKVIKSFGLKIGSTTGYTADMMKILTESAARQGYIPDAMVCASDVSEGRPAPWMALKNAELMGIYPMETIIKIGDTVADIKEGVNAGMWSIGVIYSSNEMGMTIEEVNALKPSELANRKRHITDVFIEAGADYVIDSLSEIGDLIDKINLELYCGEKPCNQT